MSGSPASSGQRLFNIASEYIDAPADRFGGATAYVCDDQRVSYAELQFEVGRVGNALRALGVEMEQRVALLLPNIPEFVTSFFGAARIGAVAAPMSTAVPADEQIFLLADSRAQVLIAHAALWAPLRARRGELPFLRHVLLIDGPPGEEGERQFEDVVLAASPDCPVAPTTEDDVAFWLHTSGSTGTPKWAMHAHRDMPYAEREYARPIVGLGSDDVVLAGGPCFHAYPLGLTTYFALAAGASVVLHRERSTPARIAELISRHRVTVFAGVPTLYALLLAALDGGLQGDLSSVRLCLSAAEPLPAELLRRWRARFGIEILDGIGTTEALHVFMSNRQGDVRDGSSGRALPGYEIRLVDDGGASVGTGEIGNLVISGGSVFIGYWNRIDTSRRTLQGSWYFTGDKYSRDADGYFWYHGRADDMLRVSGHWVSPTEVEGALMTHPAVLEAAVVGQADGDELIKPKAFVILRADAPTPTEALATELKDHVKATIAPYNYPRWIEFVTELPKTATGKIQRYKLREAAP
ncbi:MAG: benzoate-CoA ligase family protein [Chloroflexota bacterium]